MNIRKKVVVSIIVLIIALAIAILGGIQYIMVPAIGEIESREASDKVLNAVRVVDHELDTLQGSCIDWSMWDDTYNFLLEPSQDYIENNLMDDTFTSLKLNYMLFYDCNHTLIYGKGYDFSAYQPLEIPESLTINPAGSLLHSEMPGQGGEDTGIRGIVSLPEGVLLVSINPITRSDGSGPAAGYLCIARRLDETEVRKIAHLTSTTLAIRAAGAGMEGAPGLTSSLWEQDRSTRVVVSGDSLSIMSYAALKDIYGQPGVVFEVESERATFWIAQQSMLLFLFIILFIGVVSVLIILWLLDQSFLKRLAYLERRMKEIADSRDFSKRIGVSGDDEITSLSTRIDSTLDALEDHISAERNAVQGARIANEKLALLSKITSHDILNQVTVIRGFANLSKESLPPDSPAVPYIDRISTASIHIEDQLAFTKEYQLGGAQSAPAWFNISDLIRRVTWKVPLGQVEVEIQTDALEIFSDPLLERIIYNLIDNSLNHGEKVTCIRFSFRQEGNDGILVYEDDGVGIPSDQKERIFDKGVGKHRGLGLFLTRGILALTGITIRELGVPGEGARFELRIPGELYRMRKQGDEGSL